MRNIDFIPEDEDSWYFHYDINFNGIILRVALNYDNFGDYCEVYSHEPEGIPEAIRTDANISEELNDKDNTEVNIWRYDSYVESLKRFDRVLGRLFNLQNIISS